MSKKLNNKKTEEIEIIDEDETEEVNESENESKDLEYENITIEERIYQIEKKTKIIFILVILTTVFSFLTLIGGLSKNSNTDTSKTSTDTSNSASESLYAYDTSNFKEITAADIKSESSKETIVVMIGRQGCTYCASYAPILESVAEDYNVTVRYIDYDLIVSIAAKMILDQNAYDTIANLEGEGEFEGFGAAALKATPYTLFIKDNKIIYGIKGSATSSTVASAFEYVGFKK